MSLHQKKVIRISFSCQFLDQNTLVMYFESCKKSELVSSMLARVNINTNITTNKKPQLNFFLCAHSKPLPQ